MGHNVSQEDEYGECQEEKQEDVRSILKPLVDRLDTWHNGIVIAKLAIIRWLETLVRRIPNPFR